MPARIAITYESEGLRPKAEELARGLDLPLLPAGMGDFPFLLTVSAQGLTIIQTGDQAPGPVSVDFAGGALRFRRKYGGGRKQALARAVGLKKGANPFVLDATAGLGRDGFVLAALGCKVLLVERSPILAALLADGLERAESDPELHEIMERLSLLQGDSIETLRHLPEPLPEVIYLDPMYPQRTKSALVKKEMRLLQALIGEDDNAVALLQAALAKAKERVVVKRPVSAPPVGALAPSLTIPGQKHRFDVYLTSVIGRAR